MSPSVSVVAVAVSSALLIVAGVAASQAGSGGKRSPSGSQPDPRPLTVAQVLDRVRGHDFEPNNTPRGTSSGIGDLDDDAWQVRILAIRHWPACK